MPAKHLMIAIHWFGPYRSLEAARAAAKVDYNDGLYLCIGMTAYQRKPAMQYVGLAKSLHTRLIENHHKLCNVTRSRSIWLGEVVTAEPSGKKIKVTKATLDYAEWLHAKFLELPLNDMKRKNVPARGVTVLNRFFKTDYETRCGRRPHADWPDLIDFPGDDQLARAVWFGSRLRYFNSPDWKPY